MTIRKWFMARQLLTLAVLAAVFTGSWLAAPQPAAAAGPAWPVVLRRGSGATRQ